MSTELIFEKMMPPQKRVNGKSYVSADDKTYQLTSGKSMFERLMDREERSKPDQQQDFLLEINKNFVEYSNNIGEDILRGNSVIQDNTSLSQQCVLTSLGGKQIQNTNYQLFDKNPTADSSVDLTDIWHLCQLLQDRTPMREDDISVQDETTVKSILSTNLMKESVSQQQSSRIPINVMGSSNSSLVHSWCKTARESIKNCVASNWFVTAYGNTRLPNFPNFVDGSDSECQSPMHFESADELVRISSQCDIAKLLRAIKNGTADSRCIESILIRSRIQCNSLSCNNVYIIGLSYLYSNMAVRFYTMVCGQRK